MAPGQGTLGVATELHPRKLLLPSTDGCVRDYGTIRPMTDASCFYCLTDPNHKSVLVPAVTLWKGTALCADCASVTAANEKVWVS